MLTKEERKSMILQWWEEYFREGKKEVLSKYVHDDYIQHIPFLPDGPEGIHVFLDMQGGKFPTEVKRVIADEELIAIHFQAKGPPIPDHPWYRINIAVVDFFGMKDDKFSEHWFAAEPVAPTASGYEMFSDVLTPRMDMTQEQERANRQLVKEAFTDAFDGDMTALRRCTSEDPYIEHSPHVPKGARNLFEAYQKHYDSPKPPTGKVLHMIAEGDLVMAFNSYVYPENKEIVVCHFLRIWDGKIVEHWDIHTPVPPSEDFQHPNGMY